MPRIRTGYSFRKAVGKLPNVMARLKECGYSSAPITDRASTFGWVRWAKLCKDNDLKPVFGVELAVTDSLQAKRPTADYWTFIAQDSLGPINELIDLATQQFRYEPLLSYDQAINAKGMFKIVGQRAKLDLVPVDKDTFIALSPGVSKGFLRNAMAGGHQLIACSNNFYPCEDDEGFYEIVCGRGASTQTYDQHIQTPEEWELSVAKLGLDQETLRSAALNADSVLIGSNAKLKKAELLSPERPAPLRDMCIAGAKRLGVDLTDEVYAARLDRELGLIIEKDYEDYFYIVADICEFARSKMIVGPARGSSCGSLVCYLLNITTIDPIPYGLIFERFIDLNRDDLPDIDIDFSDQQRPLVFEYLNNKYGHERVARLGTVAMYKSRSALQEAGAALRAPRWKCDAVAESLIERSSGDSRALNTLEDTLLTMPAGQELMDDHPEMMIACKMEGHPRHHSQHAAGIVVSKDPVTDFIAIDHRTGATMCDKKDAEDLNLLKIDALGLTQLSVFEDALEMAGLPRNTLENLPLDDQAAFDILNDAKFSGIFQFNGQALQSITKQFTVGKFDDIVSVTALGRPGPLASGGAHEWIRRKNGVHAVTYPHPIFEPYLNDTMGIVIYQEQVMQIGKGIGDLSWEDVSDLRKAMSKSLGKEFFDKFGNPWKKGAIEKGVSPADADKVWDDLCLSGDTLLENPHPAKGHHKFIKLRDLYKRGGLGVGQQIGGGKRRQKLLMWDGQSLKPSENWGVTYSGQKQTFTLTTESGNKIRATEDHKFLTLSRGYVRLADLSVGDSVMSDGGTIPTKRKSPKKTKSGGHNWWHKLKAGEPSFAEGKRYLKANFKKCQHCKNAPYEETHHINLDREDHSIDNLMPVCRKCHKKLHAMQNGSPKAWRKGRSIFADEIKSIKKYKIEDVYDIHMPDPHHNFLAEGIVVHNCAYGAWSFNKSHSVAYGLISYQCCWLKAHHPFEFAAATLSHEGDPMRQIQILREMSAEGYDYVPVDAQYSTDKWAVGERDGKRVLVGPLSSVKGIGPKIVSGIIGARARGERIPERAMKLLSNPKTPIDSLWPVRDAFNRLMPDPGERNIFTPPTAVKDVVIRNEDYDVLVFVTLSKINPRDENEVVNIARRGYEIKDGKTASLNLQLTDDTDTVFGKIDRWKFPKLGKPVIDRGRPGKALYAVKGRVRGGGSFRMIMIQNIRYIGDIDE